jgi:hypothetical protein
LISFLYIYLAKTGADQERKARVLINSFMRIFEIEQPKSPEQQRLAQLSNNSKRASDAVKLERNRQKMQRAQKAMQVLRAPAIKKPTPMV